MPGIGAVVSSTGTGGSGRQRTITVRLRDVEPERYADIANAVWMLLEAIDCDFTVTPDGQDDAAALDKRWDDYSNVSWKHGDRGGTPQAKAAKVDRRR